jgi:FtsZ-binding cell division protein ZapB
MSQWTVGGVKNDLLCEDLLPLGQFPKPEELARVVAELQQISALQAEVARLMESGDFQLSERTRLREERDTLKRENEALRQALAWIRDVACGEAQVAEDDEHGMRLIWRRSLDVLDAAKEQE